MQVVCLDRISVERNPGCFSMLLLVMSSVDVQTLLGYVLSRLDYKEVT